MQLHAYKDSPKFSDCDFNFNYRSVTGKLNYLGQTSREDILFATHQIAKYSSDPRKEHGEQLFTWCDAWRRQGIWGSDFIQILQRVLNAIVMQISSEIGTENMHNLILALLSREVDGSFSMHGVLLFGYLNCNPKLHSLPLRLNILQCPWFSEMSFQLWSC